MRTIFENKDLKLEATVYNNSKNWGHKARAIYKGEVIAEKKITYYNRTWEKYQFETILSCLMGILDTQKVAPLKDRLELSKLIKKN